MYEFCPEHGERFVPIGDFTKYWCCVYRCPTPNCPGYIEIADAQCLPVLIRLDMGVIPKMEAASLAVLEVAFGRIKWIDYKTVSSIFLERTVLDCYRKQNEYRVVRSDGTVS